MEEDGVEGLEITAEVVETVKMKEKECIRRKFSKDLCN